MLELAEKFHTALETWVHLVYSRQTPVILGYVHCQTVTCISKQVWCPKLLKLVRVTTYLPSHTISGRRNCEMVKQKEILEEITSQHKLLSVSILMSDASLSATFASPKQVRGIQIVGLHKMVNVPIDQYLTGIMFTNNSQTGFEPRTFRDQINI